MPTLLAYEKTAAPTAASLRECIAAYVQETPDLIHGIRRGVAAFREGKVTPWEEVKRELGVG